MNVRYSGDIDDHDHKIGICINVSFCSDMVHHAMRLVSCMNVSFCCDVAHHDHKVGLLYECKLLLS